MGLSCNCLSNPLITDAYGLVRYTIGEDESMVANDVGCVIRVPEGTNTRRLECSPRDVIVDAGPRELLASSVISLATKDQEPLRFEVINVVPLSSGVRLVTGILNTRC